MHGFLGPNGAGKTTTIRILLGMTRADGGTARVLDLLLDDERVRFDVDTDEIKPVLRRLTEIGVRSLVSQPPSLEELFLRLYVPETAQ